MRLKISLLLILGQLGKKFGVRAILLLQQYGMTTPNIEKLILKNLVEY